MKLKKSLSVILSIFTLLTLIPSFSARAAENDKIVLGKFKENEFYDVIACAEYVPQDLIKNLTLRETDIPESMKNTNLRETNAVVRLKNKEDDLSVVKYLNSDGTVSDYIMAENVKYERDGTVYDKTNRLEFSLSDGGYINSDNDVKIKLPLKYNKNHGILLNYGKYSVEISPDKQPSLFSSFATKKTDEQGDYIIYGDVCGKNVDIEYHVCFSGVKDNIILNEKPSTNEFCFTIKTNGLVIDDNGVFYDNKKPVFVMSELIIFDSNNKVGGGNIAIYEEKYADTYKYIITVDDSFLNDENTVYPITVDPYIGSYDCDNELYDVEIKKDVSSVNPSNTTVRLGVYTTANGTTYSRIFYKSPYLEDFANDEEASSIFAAYLYIKNKSLYQDYLTVQVCPITATWSYNAVSAPTTLYYSIVSTSYYSYLYGGSSGHYKGVNIKNILVDFCNDTYDVTNGFCVKMKTENTSTGSCIFYSADHANNKPYIVIMRNSNTGYNFIVSKSLYKVTNLNSKTIQKVKSGNTYNVSFGNGVVETGNTDDLSPFMAVNEVPGYQGVYTLSFVCSKKENKQLYLSYYNYANSLTLVESSDGSTNPYNYWYIIFDSEGIYWRIINYFDTRYFLSSNGASAAQTNYSRWMFMRVGLDVPLIMQSDNNNCGAATVLQCLCYLSLDNLVAGSTFSDKMQSIYPNLLENNEVYAYKMIDYINQKYNTIYSTYTPYVFRYASSGTSTMIAKIQNCINMGFPAILNIFPLNNLNYYTNYSSYDGHYIVIVGYCSNNYIVRDCNRLGSDHPYFGEFIITEEELCNAYGAIAS